MPQVSSDAPHHKRNNNRKRQGNGVNGKSHHEGGRHHHRQHMNVQENCPSPEELKQITTAVPPQTTDAEKENIAPKSNPVPVLPQNECSSKVADVHPATKNQEEFGNGVHESPKMNGTHVFETSPEKPEVCATPQKAQASPAKVERTPEKAPSPVVQKTPVKSPEKTPKVDTPVQQPSPLIEKTPAQSKSHKFVEEITKRFASMQTVATCSSRSMSAKICTIVALLVALSLSLATQFLNSIFQVQYIEEDTKADVSTH